MTTKTQTPALADFHQVNGIPALGIEAPAKEMECIAFFEGRYLHLIYSARKGRGFAHLGFGEALPGVRLGDSISTPEVLDEKLTGWREVLADFEDAARAYTAAQ